MKKFILASNWKLNGNYNIISNFIYKLKKYILLNKIYYTIVFIPPIVYINSIKDKINNENFFLGAQNVDINLFGAFTGEISIKMLKDIGVKYVIIGHSERRLFHNESNEYIAKKFHIIKQNNMIPILCIGETFKEKQCNKTNIVCKKQIDSILKISGDNAFHNTIIAYEPIWAIGSGKSANIKYVRKINQFIRSYISNNSNINMNDITIQYGGAVNPENIQIIFEEPEINGVLLGGVSLIYEKFIKIIDIIHKINK